MSGFELFEKTNMSGFELFEKTVKFVQSHKECVVLHGEDSCPSVLAIKTEVILGEMPVLYIKLETEKESKEYAEAAGITEIPLVCFFYNGKKISERRKFNEQSEVFQWVRACRFFCALHDNDDFWGNFWDKFFDILEVILVVIVIILVASCIWSIVCFIWNSPKLLFR